MREIEREWKKKNNEEKKKEGRIKKLDKGKKRQRGKDSYVCSLSLCVCALNPLFGCVGWKKNMMNVF